mgnify:CR=1 FL=1
MPVESYDASINAMVSGTEYTLWSGKSGYIASSYQKVTLKSVWASVCHANDVGTAKGDTYLQVFVTPGETGLATNLYRCILSLHVFGSEPAATDLRSNGHIAINPDVVLNPGDYISCMKTVAGGGAGYGRVGCLLDVVRTPQDSNDMAQSKTCGFFDNILGRC